MKGVIKLCVGVRVHEVHAIGGTNRYEEIKETSADILQIQLLTQVRFKVPNVQRLQEMEHRFRSCMTNNSEHFMVKIF